MTETRLSSNPATVQVSLNIFVIICPFLAGFSLFGNAPKPKCLQELEVLLILHLSNSHRRLTCVLCWVHVHHNVQVSCLPPSQRGQGGQVQLGEEGICGD